MSANVGRDLRDQTRFRRTTIDQAIDQAVSTEVLDAGDAERKIDVVAVRFNLFWQERLWPETDPSVAVLYQVHRRRSNERGGEDIRRTAIDFVRGADLADTALVEDGDAVAQTHRLGLIVSDVDGGGAEAALKLLQLV